MPGWYVHMEAARQTVLKMQAGELPQGMPDGFTLEPGTLKELGQVCHTWRNYVALGSIGPDLFYLLPDFKGSDGCVIRAVVNWVTTAWNDVDTLFVAKWERWVAPVLVDNKQVASVATAGFQNDVWEAMKTVIAGVAAAIEGLIAELGDWFGILTSGVPQAYGDNAFYWSDVFHYRRTYQFAYHLFHTASRARDSATDPTRKQDAETLMAFAVGWMTHCATDVTGHPFTNTKSGGPYRDHWQRHHLVENHMDSENYSAKYGGDSRYDEYGLSALHFWVSFQEGGGRTDLPAYDYVTRTLPPYKLGTSPLDLANRRGWFDHPTHKLPAHLVAALHEAMTAVHPDGPEILKHAPGHPDAQGGTGMPNAAAMGTMWDLVFGYLKQSTSDALSPQKPRLPDPIEDFKDLFQLPIPPGWGKLGPWLSDDAPQGDGSDDDDLDLIDLLLAVLSWSFFLTTTLPAWIAALGTGVFASPAALGNRVAYHYLVGMPLWDLYRMTRRSLVMAGFIVPAPDEVDQSLTTLGTDGDGVDLLALLGQAVPDPDQAATMKGGEPSGKDPGHAAGRDEAYPRGIVRDLDRDIHRVDLVGAIGLTKRIRYGPDGGNEYFASEWLAPWKYPLVNAAGNGVAQELPFTHVGPYLAGEESTVLLSGKKGDKEARRRLEEADTPARTAAELAQLLPREQHLGTPVEYSRYLVARMLGDDQSHLTEFSVEDFNLDSDRGYAWHCWDWVRGSEPCVAKGAQVPTPGVHFQYSQPVTSPQLFAAEDDGTLEPPRWHDPRSDLEARYLDEEH